MFDSSPASSARSLFTLPRRNGAATPPWSSRRLRKSAAHSARPLRAITALAASLRGNIFLPGTLGQGPKIFYAGYPPRWRGPERLSAATLQRSRTPQRLSARCPPRWGLRKCYMPTACNGGVIQTDYFPVVRNGGARRKDYIRGTCNGCARQKYYRAATRNGGGHPKDYFPALSTVAPCKIIIFPDLAPAAHHRHIMRAGCATTDASLHSIQPVLDSAELFFAFMRWLSAKGKMNVCRLRRIHGLRMGMRKTRTRERK